MSGQRADRACLVPPQVSDEERLILPARIASGCLPLTIGPLHDAVRSRQDLDALLAHGRWVPPFIGFSGLGSGL